MFRSSRKRLLDEMVGNFSEVDGAANILPGRGVLLVESHCLYLESHCLQRCSKPFGRQQVQIRQQDGRGEDPGALERSKS